MGSSYDDELNNRYIPICIMTHISRGTSIRIMVNIKY